MQFKDVISSDKVVKLLLKEVKSDRVSHAQMLLGPEGAAKLPLAVAFSQYLLCDNPSTKDSCGECPNCQKVSSLTHPDLHFVYPVVISKTDHVSSSDDVRAEWNDILTKQKYFNVDSWLDKLDNAGKNPIKKSVGPTLTLVDLHNMLSMCLAEKSTANSQTRRKTQFYCLWYFQFFQLALLQKLNALAR